MKQLTLFPTHKRFRCFLNIFWNVRPVSPPTIGLSRSGAWRSTISYCLEACFLQSACSSSRLETSQPVRNAIRIIFFVTSAKNLRIFEIRARQTSSDILSSTFQNFHFFRVKLQTSLYHPIPLDSKPYKQTNRLENLLLFLILFLFCFVLFCVCVLFFPFFFFFSLFFFI